MPPLCRDAWFAIDRAENARLIRHIESGGVSTLLYGGNANLYNIALSEYDNLLDILESAAAENTWIIPSVGPYFGTLLDQAAILRGRKFPAAMILPTIAVSSPAGVRAAFAKFVERAGIPAVLYIKEERYVTPQIVAELVSEGFVAWIKYAVMRDNPSEDILLRDIANRVDPALLVSGMGEQPVPVHWRNFGIRAFTSGCVCVAPRLSQQMLESLRDDDFASVARICEIFRELESLRNAHGPIPVLHDAVAACGIAQTGPALPLLADLPRALRESVAAAAQRLRAANNDPAVTR
ncbi:MAG TPA: dihydrodipicolinate synthase family protein [Chthoniobacteraceae bacterium]|nr:dihydrodipicolinate synthase family protein [Chthoniobacteraceae bacterium]